MRELLRAVFRGKPLITLFEPEAKYGAITRRTIREELKAADMRYHQQWGDAILADEVRTWLANAGGATFSYGKQLMESLVDRKPIAEALYEALFRSWLGARVETIEYCRLGVRHLRGRTLLVLPLSAAVCCRVLTRPACASLLCQAFQDVTVRLIAEHLLPPNLRKCTFLRDELSAAKVHVREPHHAMGLDYHVYCSAHNAGGRKLLDELQRKHPGIKVSTTADEQARCERVLLYLRRDVWSRAEASAALRDEVLAVLNRDPHRLLLCHEMPGVDEETRRGFEFGVLFGRDEESTPQILLERGVYNTMIAVPMKGGMWRAVSLTMLAKTILSEGQVQIGHATPTAATQPPPPKSRFEGLRRSLSAMPGGWRCSGLDLRGSLQNEPSSLYENAVAGGEASQYLGRFGLPRTSLGGLLGRSAADDSAAGDASLLRGRFSLPRTSLGALLGRSAPPELSSAPPTAGVQAASKGPRGGGPLGSAKGQLQTNKV
jgi:hypothetical protein